MEMLRQQLPWVVSFLLALCVVGVYGATIAAPSEFVPGTTVLIERGSSVSLVADDLTEAHIIRHPLLLKALLRATGGSSHVQTGLYKFEKGENLFRVAYRLVTGEYGVPPVRLTFIEGVTRREAAVQVEDALPGIAADDFLSASEELEGYLFPDTYFFQPGVETTRVVATMRANFDTRTATLREEIETSGRSLRDIVTMASLIEKEARTIPDKHLIAGILWNRIKIGMPLQVDAVFGYIFGRDTYSPSPADLKVNSPYNTYTHVGLPPGPINNPGLDSLRAAANPTKTPYLYYLTGNDGLMYYATTYAGHQANLRKYLR